MKHKRLVRVFFSTYDDSLAKGVVDMLAKFGQTKVKQSQIVREFYYVEVIPASSDREALVRTANEIEKELKKIKELSDVKVYYVET